MSKVKKCVLSEVLGCGRDKDGWVQKVGWGFNGVKRLEI